MTLSLLTVIKQNLSVLIISQFRPILFFFQTYQRDFNKEKSRIDYYAQPFLPLHLLRKAEVAI